MKGTDRESLLSEEALLSENALYEERIFLYIDNKDNLSRICKYLIINLDEIDDWFKTKDNRDNFKSFVSTENVSFRPAYGRKDETYPRIASFLGSCNEAQFLNDPTGTDRFMVFDVIALKNRRYNEERGIESVCCEDFDINEVWAEAYFLYKKGYSLEWSDEDTKINEEANKQYRYVTDEDETLSIYLKPGDKEDLAADFMKATEIANYLNFKQNEVVFSGRKIGKSLLNNGFKRIGKFIGNNAVYGYFVKKIVNFQRPTPF